MDGWMMSFCGSPSNFSLTKSPVLKLAPPGRLRRLRYGSPCRPDVIARESFANNKVCDFFFFQSILPRVEQPWNVR